MNPGRFTVMRSRAPGDSPQDPRFALLATGSNSALATGMTKAVADDVAGAMSMMVDSQPPDAAGALALRKLLDASGQVAIGEASPRDAGMFHVTDRDGARFVVRVRLVDRVEPPRLLPPVPDQPKMNGWGKWEMIEGAPDLRRIAVPGGWLYQSGSPNKSPGPLTFVPDPDHPTGAVDKRF